MTLGRQEISLLAHADHPIACPLSDVSVERLLDALSLAPDTKLLDIGCGEGEWLARVTGAGIHKCGVDLSGPALAKARGKLGPDARLVEAPAADFLASEGHWDAILCNGASHALGGAGAAIALLASKIAPGGAVLFSDGCWQVSPTREALDALGAEEGDILHFDQVLAAIEAAGLRATTVLLSSPQEWDDYENAWCGALERHATRIEGAEPGDAALLRQVASEHRTGYVDGYRGVLGYVAIVARH